MLLKWIASKLAPLLISRAKRTPYTHLVHPDGTPYMMRYWLFRSRLFCIRLHHIRDRDLDPHMHDHPWYFISWLLKGAYVERRPVNLNPSFIPRSAEFDPSSKVMIEPSASKLRSAGSFALRAPYHRHQISMVAPETWSLFITSPIMQWWGFYTPEGKIHWRDYPSTHSARSEVDPSTLDERYALKA